MTLIGTKEFQEDSASYPLGFEALRKRAGSQNSSYLGARWHHACQPTQGKNLNSKKRKGI
jgi:hypothetical protein